MAKQLGFYFDQTLCTGCKACQVACKDKNDLPVGVTWRRVAEYSGGTWQQEGDTFTPNVFTYYTSISCNHCDEPACVQVCPTTAMHKDEHGIVTIDDGKCVGCRYCEWACPYGAPQYDKNAGVMTKCDLCIDRVNAGEQPACVAACPSRALEFGEIEELRAKYGDTAAIGVQNARPHHDPPQPGHHPPPRRPAHRPRHRRHRQPRGDLMNVHELPLVAFTILAQMSVGSFVILGLVQLSLVRTHGQEAVDKLSIPALYAIGPAMVLGLAGSMLHLGDPFNALNAINHLGSSWLSREILFGSAFAGLGATFALVQWRNWLTPMLRQILAGVTALVGLALVYCMSMVYMLPTVPAWNHWATPVTFFTTTFLLGALAIGAAFAVVYTLRKRKHQDDDMQTAALLRTSLRRIAASAIVLLGVEFIVLPIYALDLATGNANAKASAALLMTGGGAYLIARLVLVFAGAGILGFFLYRFAGKGAERHLVYLATTAFALVIASETIGRLLFYSSFDRIGM
ncbi:DMSO/selenate family reductase complex B subunit [Cellulomonas timonensis]|uniref:DMSO/selenate family reductase complex B subunit n=2 Tax=Cellulomonas timonensis TaxID=1689271 RepID=UPI000AE33A63|nr:DMSO/selenate family reductase complex B subunit [Cellulomonas timonensis]